MVMQPHSGFRLLHVVQGCGPGSSSERTRTAITAALRKKLRDLMGEFQQLRQRLQDEYRCAVAEFRRLCGCLCGRALQQGISGQKKEGLRPGSREGTDCRSAPPLSMLHTHYPLVT